MGHCSEPERIREGPSIQAAHRYCNSATSSYLKIFVFSSATSAKDSATSAFDPEFLPQRAQSLSQRSQRKGRDDIKAGDQGLVELVLPTPVRLRSELRRDLVLDRAETK